MSAHYTATNIPGLPGSSNTLSLVYNISNKAPGLETPPEDEADQPHYVPGATSLISTAFFSGSHNSISDVVFRSSDGVMFYVGTDDILHKSGNAFEPFLGSSLSEERFKIRNGAIIDIPESSAVLDVILHTLYHISCARHAPTIDDIEEAVYRMPVYGIDPKAHIVPANPLFDLLLSKAPLYPLRIYTLAGHFRAHELALKTSSHLLSYNLANLTDEISIRMGPIYLNKLMALHLNTVDSLKKIILQPPDPHGRSNLCGSDEQKALARAWALSASYLAWDSNPGELARNARVPNFRHRCHYSNFLTVVFFRMEKMSR
ncbi:hypothetical protein JR316_0010102 [Psilocybe cubensis]|uniref:Uncharacterized protein n=2 Tax=Psilocybe cubensis TaxID=181762 RepID=A0A8H8CGI4_PSICU|nr:hypothetical protein JR316_0010102 [Psilocybe cubensis]KAH9477870.1 hypothetical protein JR316_0010102 [Psilocybe cubensis]